MQLLRHFAQSDNESLVAGLLEKLRFRMKQLRDRKGRGSGGSPSATTQTEPFVGQEAASLAIEMWARLNNWRRVNTFLEELKSNGKVPLREACLAALEMWERLGENERMNEIRQLMRDNYLMKDEYYMPASTVASNDSKDDVRTLDEITTKTTPTIASTSSIETADSLISEISKTKAGLPSVATPPSVSPSFLQASPFLFSFHIRKTIEPVNYVAHYSKKARGRKVVDLVLMADQFNQQLQYTARAGHAHKVEELVKVMREKKIMIDANSYKGL